MGSHADRVADRLLDRLAAAQPAMDWTTERRVGSTPVDVGGVGDDALCLVELEWRRADPADNAAKLFRHLADGALDGNRRVVVCQLFTAYYDLTSGGVSSKRLNAEFVGRTAAESFERVGYRPVDLAINPPKRGGDLPDDWGAAVDEAAEAVDATLA
ncbi:hypothetical protein [Halostella salina]|uniref:hypothetical protein n=1 Tax=Halostella salina TaxID=1547897 RepID=UPI000EF81576|nr:hypothetical protein [Halostella salina]